MAALKSVEKLPESVFNTQHSLIWDKLDLLVGKGCLYLHQVEAVKELKRELGHSSPTGKRIALAVLPTGTGKTGVCVLAAYVCNASKVLVVTPSETISRQQFADFRYEHDHACAPFLERRGIFPCEERDNYMPRGRLVLKTNQLLDAMDSSLVVVNAHKFGTTSSVDLAKVPQNFSLVIIDEAHHYPAPTWARIVNHFKQSRIIFLTATPYNGGEYILDKLPCYTLSREVAVQRHIIRPLEFIEVEGGPTRNEEIKKVLFKMKEVLDAHDDKDRRHQHQGMVLADSIYEANDIARLWNDHIGTPVWAIQCAAFIGSTPRAVLTDFEAGRLRILVVIRRLIEGFDRKPVSVVAILRNVQTSSRVYFAQFVGRAVRKIDGQDQVKTTIISHRIHNQHPNYQTFDQLAEVDPEEPEYVAQTEPMEH